MPANLESYLACLADGERALGTTRGTSEDPVGVVFRQLRDRSEGAVAALKIFSRGLESFPLHPYLLTWRANVRFRIAFAGIETSEDSLQIPVATEAASDLLLAIQVAPDYLEPRIDLAFHTLNYRDDAVEAAKQFDYLIERLTARLCDCAAGHVEALRDAGQELQAEEQLERWLRAFPDSSRLLELRRSAPAG